ncbi:nicotinate phosphoribosyltransferase isoform X2 [Nerophis lumbriciformis]|uniref:nicotinate phosphoribosyltransferase isoform X2 n=1 Tax=Nerophis lumbriciformis TaxID=546530 RepID=UPI002ADFD198|nr:nicotinate phosphoribosyltransferase-like isoform X2 [Nerophis lumbriciformis]
MAAPRGDTRAVGERSIPGGVRMERSILDRVPSLLTDLYQFTMAYAYWRAGRHQDCAAFELFFRQNPFGGGFALFAGLSDCLNYIKTFHFTDEDVDFLRSVLPPATDAAFFQYLRGLDCSGVTLRAVPEGTVVFARVRGSGLWARGGLKGQNCVVCNVLQEPLMEVAGPLVVVQLLETSLLCLVNYASLVCSNAARFRLASGHKRKLLEMGLRRAQGPDGGLTASRYSYIGGFDMTSNVQAGLLFGVPVSGTMAHSYVTSFTSLEEALPKTLVAVNGNRDAVDLISLTKSWLGRVCKLLGADPEKIHDGELAAFLSYAIAYPKNFLPVIDSYSVTCGLLNFCAVALALCELGYRPLGVRLDSGDLCKQSLDVRSVLRLCSEHFSISAFDSLTIVGSNNISEQTMVELNTKENEIDVVGVGTHLVTCTKQPSLGCVYKLVEVQGKPRMKISEDPEKSTVPGRKAVYRLIDADGYPFLDLLCLALESPPEAGRPVSCHPLGTCDTPLTVTPAEVTCLRQEMFTKGQVTQPLSSAAQSKEQVQQSLQKLHPRHKRLQEPDSYTVALSEKLHMLARDLRRGITNKNNVVSPN